MVSHLEHVRMALSPFFISRTAPHSHALCHREGFTVRPTPASRFSHAPVMHPTQSTGPPSIYLLSIYSWCISWCISGFFCHRTNWSTAQPSKASHTSPLPAVKSSLEISFLILRSFLKLRDFYRLLMTCNSFHEFS